MTHTIEKNTVFRVNPLNPFKGLTNLLGLSGFPNHSNNDFIINYGTYYRGNAIFRVNPP